MSDLISSLPDEIICYILYFLPSKQVVATSVLSKRWTLLWRYVSSLDFDLNQDFYEDDHDNGYCHSMHSFLVRRGDQPLYKFRIRGYSCDITKSIKSLIRTALSGSGRVQIIDLFCLWEDTAISSMVFNFKTLVALKLKYTIMEDISFVDLPFLKFLHLKYIISLIEDYLSQILSGCPNLEDLKVRVGTSEAKGKFIRLSKLVRANIDNILLSLETFKEVEVLRFNWLTPVRFITFYNCSLPHRISTAEILITT
ncbi:hypothetical protein V8G54_027114 [Vigna mungo]|uniref:F-box domain-containing protein n=1 Tax=Vigna mungo TaxID=3915 RepID=A0AAQ3N1U1_VIGMU